VIYAIYVRRLVTRSADITTTCTREGRNGRISACYVHSRKKGSPETMTSERSIRLQSINRSRAINTTIIRRIQHNLTTKQTQHEPMMSSNIDNFEVNK